jgi:ribosomal protein S27E
MNIEVTVKMPKEDLDKAVESGVEQAMKECELTIGMTLKEAVEKQIPKKPMHYDSVPHDRCPNCRNAVKVFRDAHEYHYCLYCGQRLKWGD